MIIDDFAINELKKAFPNCITFTDLDSSFKIDFDAYIVVVDLRNSILGDVKKSLKTLYESFKIEFDALATPRKA